MILSFNYTRSESQSEKRSLSYYSLERRSDWSLLIRKAWDKNSQYASIYQQISIQISLASMRMGLNKVLKTMMKALNSTNNSILMVGTKRKHLKIEEV